MLAFVAKQSPTVPGPTWTAFNCARSESEAIGVLGGQSRLRAATVRCPGVRHA